MTLALALILLIPWILLDQTSATGLEYPGLSLEDEVVEDDILLTAEQWALLKERRLVTSKVTLWPEGEDGSPFVPFLFDEDFDDKDIFLAGVAHWMNHTCIKFGKSTNGSEEHYIRITRGTGCHSYIGRISSRGTGQPLYIGEKCKTTGHVIHELGHALGLHHEQSRSDRDRYIVILRQNIREDKMKNFLLKSENNYSVPYDYTSIMHYGYTITSKNGLPTIITKDPLAQGLIGQREGLSHRDKLLANRMYNCTKKWLVECGLTADPCKNEGYLGKNCNCTCPLGTSGPNCEIQQVDGYYAKLYSPYSEIVTTEGSISTPNFPDKFAMDLEMTKLIRAPSCHRPRLTFDVFDLSPREDGECTHDALFVRMGTEDYNITVYCGKEIPAGKVIESTRQDMVLFFHSSHLRQRGWRSLLDFVHDPACS